MAKQILTESVQTASGAQSRPVILDGALGTELERRGFETTLPLWSAKALIEAPGLVWEIHCDYVKAGAEVLTACTFRTTPYTLRKVGLEQRAEELTHQAIRYARAAASDTPPCPPAKAGGNVKVAGCIAPIEDCYHPELAPADDVLRKEHARFAKMLAETGVDLILVETQNSQREAIIATETALATGLPVWTSLMPKSATEMFNGDPLAEAAERVQQLGAEVILINCARPAIAAGAFGVLAQTLPNAKLGLYPNLLPPQNLSQKTHSKQRMGAEILQPEDGLQDDKRKGSVNGGEMGFAEWLSRFAGRASVLGGCCGTTPEHIAALHRNLFAEG